MLCNPFCLIKLDDLKLLLQYFVNALRGTSGGCTPSAISPIFSQFLRTACGIKEKEKKKVICPRLL